MMSAIYFQMNHLKNISFLTYIGEVIDGYMISKYKNVMVKFGWQVSVCLNIFKIKGEKSP